MAVQLRRGEVTSKIKIPSDVFAFDLLALRGRDLRMLPLIERKRGLAQLLRAASPACKNSQVKAPALLVYADHVEGWYPAISARLCGRPGGHRRQAE